MRLKIRVGYDFTDGGYKLAIEKFIPREIVVATNYVRQFAGRLNDNDFTNITEGDIIPIAGHMSQSDAQELFDSLWREGIRPTDVIQVETELTATRRHLALAEEIIRHYLALDRNPYPINTTARLPRNEQIPTFEQQLQGWNEQGLYQEGD